MSWFGKKEEQKKPVMQNTGLPDLPKLPELPTLNSPTTKNSDPLHQLPSFPSTNFGEQMSQSTIKEAITGKKEDEEDSEADDLEHHEGQMMRGPLQKEMPLYPEDEEEVIPRGFRNAIGRVRKTEPVFIRIDKFEESLKVFEKAKSEISEIEHMLSNIKKIKDEEEQELSSWETQIQSIKKQIEKVDADVFSKVE